jgi:tetratricopeptide (TPR) repeat protein
MSHEAIAQAVDVLLDVLGAVGVPGTSVARRAIRGVESLRQSQAARQRLEELLKQAEEDFIQQARKEGLERAAQWVASLPIQNLPTFRQALESLRERWNEEALTDRLAKEFAQAPGIQEEQKARALALYLTCLRTRLLADDSFRQVIVCLSILRTEARVERLLGVVDAFYGLINRLIGLPEDLVAWPVRTLSEITELRADLLLPRYRLVPYTGEAFQETLHELLTWVQGLEEAKPPVGLRTYIGPGGAGKTRLLIEAGEALRSEGWWVSFLRVGWLTKENARLLSTDARPTLLIVDYIANRDREVRDLLHEVARVREERATPMAIVLLERTFPDWLRKDLSDYTDPEYVGWPAFLSLPTVEKEPRTLPALGREDRRELFRKARRQFAEIIRADGRSLPDYSELPGAPLHVLLLALLAAMGERVERPTDLEEVLKCTWSRERAAWERHLAPLLEGQPQARWNYALEIVEDLSVLATLGRSFPSPKAAVDLLEARYRPIPGIIWGELVDLLPKLFPRAERSLIPPIEPDPLADFVLKQRLAERPHLVPLALPGREEAEAEPDEASSAALEALGVLARLWERAAAEPERKKVEGWMRAAAEHLASWPSLAWTSLDRVLPPPDRTLALRPFLADFYRTRLERIPPEAEEERAPVLGMLGFALSTLGLREEALKATEEAVAIYRKLSEQNPQAFLPYLAGSLNNLGLSLSELGLREEALKATEEAVKIRRKLSEQNPQAFLPDLASSLNNLGLSLSELGLREEALKATEEAVAIYRKLSELNPQAFLPYLAMSLNNLGNRLSELGRREEALKATEEAVAIYRKLSELNPQAFLPYLAASLNNLGKMLSELGRREEALKNTEEAVGIYRKLSELNPQAFLPYLARSLGAHGSVLHGLGRHAEAAAAFAEGLHAILPFVRAIPAAFGELAGALLRDYLRACKEAKQEPDWGLVEEVRRLVGGD